MYYNQDLTYQNNVKLDSQKILHLSDTITYDSLDQFLQHAGSPKYIINDTCFGHHDRPEIFCIPIHQAKWMQHEFQDLNYVDDIESDFCFNFIVNKKFPNRDLMLKMIEYFDLYTEHYTWNKISDTFDMADFIKELNLLDKPLQMDNADYESFFTQILSPCSIKSKFIEFPGQKITTYAVENYGDNVWTWCNGLDKIFQNTVVSLISESVAFQKISTITEKTLYSVLGLTFPIWIGGFGTADAWEKAGLDSFSDIVDHSYQYHDTLVERCYFAFKNNLPLLQDLSFAQSQRIKCHSRLLENRKKILNGALLQYCEDTVAGWPKDLQQSLRPMFLDFELYLTNMSRNSDSNS